jgi:hypothetical protein
MMRAVVLVAGVVMLADVSHGRDVMECSAMRGPTNAAYWAWRDVDGRKCWYVGRPGKPKSELYWGRTIPPDTSVRAKRPQDAVDSEPAAVVVAKEAGEFDRRWNDLLSDMAMPFWRWRQPISDERLWRNEHD